MEFRLNARKTRQKKIIFENSSIFQLCGSLGVLKDLPICPVLSAIFLHALIYAYNVKLQYNIYMLLTA